MCEHYYKIVFTLPLRNLSVGASERSVRLRINWRNAIQICAAIKNLNFPIVRRETCKAKLYCKYICVITRERKQNASRAYTRTPIEFFFLLFAARTRTFLRRLYFFPPCSFSFNYLRRRLILGFHN